MEHFQIRLLYMLKMIEDIDCYILEEESWKEIDKESLKELFIEVRKVDRILRRMIHSPKQK